MNCFKRERCGIKKERRDEFSKTCVESCWGKKSVINVCNRRIENALPQLPPETVIGDGTTTNIMLRYHNFKCC